MSAKHRRKKREKQKNQRADSQKSPSRRRLIYEVDLHGMTWEMALRRLRAAPREAAYHKSRLLKIIHGWGRETGSNVLQQKARQWLRRKPFRYRAVIIGEEYDLMNPTTVQLRDEIGQYPDNDLNARNRGMTLIWLR